MLGSILGAVGGIASSLLGNSQANKQAKLQKEFAQNAIQWKVADANAAGIHPLYALGANTVSYSPQSIGMPDLGAMGQDIGGAIDRVSTGPERVGGKVLAALQLERAGLENDLLRANIAKTRTEALPPGPSLAPNAPGELVPGWTTLQPELGQAAENAYSEAGGNFFGGVGLTGDYFRNLARMKKGALPYLKRVHPMLNRTGRNTGFPRYGGVQ